MNKRIIILCFMQFLALMAVAEPSPRLALCASGDRRAGDNLASDGGCVPLHCAVYVQHWELVNLLLEYKADIHRKNIEGRTPMDYARMANCERQFSEACMAHGIEVNVPTVTTADVIRKSHSLTPQTDGTRSAK